MVRFPGSALVSTFALLSTVIPTISASTYYIQGTDAKGVTRELANDRDPALFTGDFGDCLAGNSLINVTRFDAAYYADNMTVLFHFDGTTNVRNESIMSGFASALTMDIELIFQQCTLR
jgi:hypothetical protein